MNLSRFSLTSAALFFLGAAVAQPAAIMVNSTCEMGSCSSVDSITYGQTAGSSFSFNYTFADGDLYNVAGNWSASYGSGGNQLNVIFSSTYGGPTASVANDSMTFDLLQNIFDSSAGTFNGTYTEHVPTYLSTGVGSASTISAEVFYDGQGVGLIGPFGVGSNYGQQSAYLTGLTGNTLTEDYRFTLNFGAGTQSGASAASATPEPAQAIPLAASLVGLGFMALRRKRTRA